MKPSVHFDSIAGVPVHYSRQPVDRYGWRGKPRHCGPVTPEFHAALDLWMDELGELCPWGKPELLVTGGVTGDGHGKHGEGRAIDIDSLWWPGRPALVCQSGPDKQPELYLAVEATLRRAFGVVLNAWYNRSHEDHWHVDDGQPPEWREGSRSRTLWLQAALSHVWGRDLAVDGQLGPRTRGAALDVLKGLLCDNLAAGWPVLLRASAVRGFEAAAAR